MQSFLVPTPVQHLGCSDEEYESDFSNRGEVSEFSSTPNTSVDSTPNSTPAKIAQPLPLKGSQIVSRGKDLSLIMKPGRKYDTPVQSLYLREMARSKTTPKLNPRKSEVEGKTQREPIPATLPRKKLRNQCKVLKRQDRKIDHSPVV